MQLMNATKCKISACPSLAEAGRKEWGTGMLDDIYTVTQQVKDLPYIDASRICITGASYGGYASLAAPLKYPSAFKCAASLAGVTDVQLYVSELDAGNRTIKWLTDYVGDGYSESERLRDISPVYQASDFNIPLLIAHGADDEIVDIEHYHRMRYALDQAGISYEQYLFKDMGHGFTTQQQQVEFYSKLASFLDRNIGK